MKKPGGILAIVGATATGKSSLAVEVALRLGGEIISADAFAVYRGMDAGTAKPSPEDRQKVPHHLVDVRDPREAFSAGEFSHLAREAARQILGRGRLPILCGGTGFYIRTFFEGLFEGPTRDEPLRRALEAAGRRRPGLLKRMIDLLDPESGEKILLNDAARAIRYLEISILTGKLPSELFRQSPGTPWDLPSRKVLLTLPRVRLYERIQQRFHDAISIGLPGEVGKLLEDGLPVTAPGMNAIGYRETVDLVEGRIDRKEWEERVIGATRRFAKRQETWFRRELDLIRVDAEREDLVDFVLAESEPLFS
ncbi:MAG TPA: tRNA (adenosine(37)-N6)-dimethylallyltransferase MiaA [Thermoanaerobaculia bacterium]|jgi:tRNA dimethylallyltransferase